MVIQFEQVTFEYEIGQNKTFLGLDQMDLIIEEGQFVAIMGESGSGKSTLLQHFNGLLQPTAGKACILDFHVQPGTPLNGISKLRQRVGLLFQFPEQQLFEETVEKDICFGPMNFGASEQDAKEAARKVIETLQLDPSVLQRSPFQLSGGQIRKVAMATILVMDPDIYVLDEPTASLDQKSREEIMQLLHSLCKEQGKTVVVVTHRLDEVLPYADEFVIMNKGTNLFQGDRSKLLQNIDVAEQAGVVVPPSLQFMSALSERFQESNQADMYTAKDIAEHIVQLIQQD